MKRILVLAFTVIALASCRQIDSGTVTITNTLDSSVRITLSENYDSSIFVLAPGETITRGYDVYRTIYFPDETPRATYTETGDTYTIVPLAAKPMTIYVTNEYGSAVTLINAAESDTADYAIPAGASMAPISFSYYLKKTFALKGIDEKLYYVKATVEPGIADKSELDKTYVLIRSAAY